jgi:hypothetical protein
MDQLDALVRASPLGIFQELGGANRAKLQKLRGKPSNVIGSPCDSAWLACLADVNK